MTIGLSFSSGNDAMSAKPWSMVRSCVADPHPHVAVDEARRALGVERDEVDRRARLAGRVVRAAQAVLEKVLHELAAAAGDVRPADARRRQRAPHAGDRVVVQLARTPRACRASSRCSARSRPPSTTARPPLARTSRRSASPTGRRARPTSRSPSADRPSRCRSRSYGSPGRHSCWYGSGLYGQRLAA